MLLLFGHWAHHFTLTVSVGVARTDESAVAGWESVFWVSRPAGQEAVAMRMVKR